jgi:hypothetical protein
LQRPALPMATLCGDGAGLEPAWPCGRGNSSPGKVVLLGVETVWRQWVVCWRLLWFFSYSASRCPTRVPWKMTNTESYRVDVALKGANWGWSIFGPAGLLVQSVRQHAEFAVAEREVEQFLASAPNSRVLPVPAGSMQGGGHGFHFRITGSNGVGYWSVYFENDELARGVDGKRVADCEIEISEIVRFARERGDVSNRLSISLQWWIKAVAIAAALFALIATFLVGRYFYVSDSSLGSRNDLVDFASLLADSIAPMLAAIATILILRTLLLQQRQLSEQQLQLTEQRRMYKEQRASEDQLLNPRDLKFVSWKQIQSNRGDDRLELEWSYKGDVVWVSIPRQSRGL